MSVAHILLGLLAEQPMHGYELRAAFEERLGAVWNLNFGQVYPALDKLADQGLLEIHTEPRGGRDRKIYLIREEGRQELARWLAAEPDPVRVGREEVFLRLAVAAWSDATRLPEVVTRHRRAQQVSLAELVSIQSAIDPVSDALMSLVVDAAILRVEAELKWLDRVEERLPLLTGVRRTPGNSEGRKQPMSKPEPTEEE